MLIYISELNTNKNQTSLLDALKEVLTHRQDVSLMLVGTRANEDNLRMKSEVLGISEHVIFTGYRSDVSALLNASDIAVPSTIREGLGLNVLEAMACGVPVVAYDNRGHRSVIEDGVNGYIVPNSDYKAMANKVKQLINNPIEYQRISHAGKRSVVEFSTENVLDMMKNVYFG